MKDNLILPRRDVLMMGGAGLLGTFIAAATVKDAGATQMASIKNIKANLHKLRIGEFNPNYASALVTGWRRRSAISRNSASTTSRSPCRTSTSPA